VYLSYPWFQWGLINQTLQSIIKSRWVIIGLKPACLLVLVPDLKVGANTAVPRLLN
jgi:hypothetical protein